MTHCRVWAPRAGRVRLARANELVELSAVESGYFEAEVHGSLAGLDYGYVLDDGPVLPDPRSPWQPNGVDGSSRGIHHGDFPWTDDRFVGFELSSAVFYELHVGTFSPEGTFDGVVQRLDHLVDLGITAIELMPVAQFPGIRGWGYDGTFLYAPYAAYGSPDSLKRLVDACHARGLGVVLDVVYNHVGPYGNYLPRFGPYFTDRYKTPWGVALNLDGPDSDPVREFICDNALMWLRDYHFDGLRLDAVHAIVDMSARHILEELANRVAAFSRERGRPKWLIAESDLNDPRVVTSPERGGYGIDAQWSDDFHHALHARFTGERGTYYGDFGTSRDLAASMTDAFVYAGRYSPHRKRIHGRDARHVPANRFVFFHQNHDQVGNRARGERSSALFSASLQKVAAALVLTSPYVPLLFQGEEWRASSPFLYFTDHATEELGRAVRRGRAREFGFPDFETSGLADPQSVETFVASKLTWAESESGEHAEMLDWYCALIRLRRDHADPFGGHERPSVRFDEEEEWLIVTSDPMHVACNFGARARRISLGDSRSRTTLLSSSADSRLEDGCVVLAAESVLIFRNCGGDHLS